MQFFSMITRSERRLAALIFGLSLLGVGLRGGRKLSPDVEAWLSGMARPETTGRVRDLSGGPPDTLRVPATVSPGAVSSLETEPAPGKDPAVDPNRAGAGELIRLPGVGPVLAGRILEDRARNGPFRTPEDLLRVPGIGPATLRRLKPHLAFP